MPSFNPIQRPLGLMRRHLPPVNFITAHWMYFILTCLLSAIIFWGSSTPFRSISFTDSLFLTVSAMTLAGLNTVNLSALNTFQQFMLFVLIMLGSTIFVSAFVVHIRRMAFESKFRDVYEQRQRKRDRMFGRVRTWATKSSKGGATSGNDDEEAVNEDETVKRTTAEDGGQLSRRSTPPERRGGPEMNRTTSHLAENSPPDSTEIGDEDKQAADHNGHANSAKLTAITFRGDTKPPPSQPPGPPTPRIQGGRRLSMQGIGARPTANLSTSTSVDLPSYPSIHRDHTVSTDPRDISRYFDSAMGWVSRNSQFHNLSEAERQHLGGYEYRAVELLSWVVPAYFILWQLIGCIGCGAWIAINDPEAAAVNAQNPWWVGAFNAVSAFNNSGMSLLNANMIAFQRSYYLLITMGLLILAGNTMYPVFLRLILWCMYKISVRLSTRDEDPSDSSWTTRAKTLRFLLDHPRRCYTTLFPAPHTWWLAFSIFVLNGIDWAAFEILNINNDALKEGLPLRYRVIDGLFQAFAVRSGGFYVVTIDELRIALLVLYVVMMYISVYPVVITMRNSNVYEERSLGIYAEDDSNDDGLGDVKKPKEGTGNAILRRAKTFGNHIVSVTTIAPDTRREPINTNFVRHQLRAQLSHDAWFLVTALFFIMIIETDSFNNSPIIFSVFNFVFEIVSAYGCVGISVGVPYADYSFCGAWHTLSKLILCAVMLRGRHRGLPVAIDKAVLLPGSHEQDEAEEDDGRIRVARTMTKSRFD